MKRLKFDLIRYRSRMEKFISWYFLFILLIISHSVKSQSNRYQGPPPAALADQYTGSPSARNDSVNGSPYFSSGWLQGRAELTINHSIPKADETLFFNYDKMTSTLITADSSSKLTYYKINFVNSFILIDSVGKAYKFEKIPAIGSSFFLTDVVKSDSGYSLFKRYITKSAVEDHLGTLNNSDGLKYTIYTDYTVYYLLYPDKTTFKDFRLTGNSVKKTFKEESAQVTDFIQNYKGNFNEEALITIVQMLNAKKPQKAK
jgi:hypothetical protein